MRCVAEHGAPIIELEEEEAETREQETLREQQLVQPTQEQREKRTASTRLKLLAESKPHVEEASADAHIGLHAEEAAVVDTAAAAADRALSQCAARVLSYIPAVIASAVPFAARATRLFACAQVQIETLNSSRRRTPSKLLLLPLSLWWRRSAHCLFSVRFSSFARRCIARSYYSRLQRLCAPRSKLCTRCSARRRDERRQRSA